MSCVRDVLGIFGFNAGMGMAAVIRYAVTTEELYTYGWRIPFWLSSVLCILGLYVRSMLTGTYYTAKYL